MQLPGSYDSTPLHRVPIIVTGNDFSTLYAPLIRDGRMEKFYWEPRRDDKVGIVKGIFEPDGFSQKEVEQLVDTFVNQSIDFFSALRSRIYDEQIRNYIHQVGFERVSLSVVNSAEGPPEFKKPDFRLSHLISLVTSSLVNKNGWKIPIWLTITTDSIEVEIPNLHSLLRTPINQPSSNGATQEAKTNGNGFQKQEGSSPHLTLDTQAQIRQLLSQGYKISIEHVDERVSVQVLGKLVFIAILMQSLMQSQI